MSYVNNKKKMLLGYAVHVNVLGIFSLFSLLSKKLFNFKS